MKIGEQILYEDSQILVVHKPPKVAVQTGRVGSQDMVSLLKNYLYRQTAGKQEPYLAVIHRLDQPVEGVLVFAKTAFAARELNRELQKNSFCKEYQVIVCGRPQEETGTLADYMVKEKGTNLSRVCKKEEPDAKKAVLHYRVERVLEEERTLLYVRLETGRHHQIRVQMANAGCPVLGDAKYNPDTGKEKAWEQIALCAYRLSFPHPKTKKRMEFSIIPSGEVFQKDGCICMADREE